MIPAVTPTVTAMRVVPVAGHDSMLLNLSGAHGPFFTRNLVILTDSSGRTGIGEVHVGHGISGSLGMAVSVAVRPEKVSIGKQAPAGMDHNVFKGRVKEIAYFGSYNTYIVVTPQGARVKITEPNGSRHERLDITWEDEVLFWWDDTDAVVLRD